MSQQRPARPSPALVISIIALFVALGGSAYAVKRVGTKELKASAVTTAKIKRNAVTAAKIKRNAVTTAKIRNGAVTGSKIREGTLSVVPGAATATDAVNATNFSRYFTSGLKKAGLGEDVVLLTVGPFTFTGKCENSGAGKTRARTILTTSQEGSNAYAAVGGYWQNDFNPGLGLEVGYTPNSTGTEVAFFDPDFRFFTAESPDGSVLLEGQAGNAVNAFGAACAFNTIAMQNG